MTLDRRNRIPPWGIVTEAGTAAIAHATFPKGVTRAAAGWVYTRLCIIASLQGTASSEGQSCRAAPADITGGTGMSERHVRRCLDELERVGVIVRQPLGARATHYTFLYPGYPGGTTTRTPESAGPPPVVPSNAAERKPLPQPAPPAPSTTPSTDSRVRSPLEEKETKRDSARARDEGTENALPPGETAASRAAREYVKQALGRHPIGRPVERWWQSKRAT